MVKIIKCDCSHEYQNEKYGKSMRVGNECKVGLKVGHRCTVCSKVHVKAEKVDEKK